MELVNKNRLMIVHETVVLSIGFTTVMILHTPQQHAKRDNHTFLCNAKNSPHAGIGKETMGNYFLDTTTDTK
jgi:hypothetical protein